MLAEAPGPVPRRPLQFPPRRLARRRGGSCIGPRPTRRRRGAGDAAIPLVTKDLLRFSAAGGRTPLHRARRVAARRRAGPSRCPPGVAPARLDGPRARARPRRRRPLAPRRMRRHDSSRWRKTGGHAVSHSLSDEELQQQRRSRARLVGTTVPSRPAILDDVRERTRSAPGPMASQSQPKRGPCRGPWSATSRVVGTHRPCPRAPRPRLATNIGQTACRPRSSTPRPPPAQAPRGATATRSSARRPRRAAFPRSVTVRAQRPRDGAGELLPRRGSRTSAGAIVQPRRTL